jgi:phospholipase/carboxylesterase
MLGTPRGVRTMSHAEFPTPSIAARGSQGADAPLVVLLHGRGSHEDDIIVLADSLPAGPAYVAVRAPIDEGGGYAWFANRGIGRPVAQSLRATMDWFRHWLDAESPPERPVVLIGFSGGAAFAGGLLLDDPARYAAAAILFGTLPFDAGVPATPGRLSGRPIFVGQGDRDDVIPRPLLDETWRYLVEESGATVATHRELGGHALTPGTVDALHGWVDGLLGTPHLIVTTHPER